ncbi:hypothetical protein D3C75_841360 [compost metagenome]
MLSTPSGTFTKKIHSQLRFCVRIPPSAGPLAAATPETAPHMPIIRPCISFGKVVVVRGMVTGTIIAPARPWITRSRISIPSDGANPASRDVRVKRATPKMNTFFRPN